MTTSFPLYNSLSANLTHKDLTTLEKREFIQKINEIDEEGIELVYALIRFYQMENCEDTNLSLPFEGFVENNDIVFNLENFPKKLKKILFRFVSMHTNKNSTDSLDLKNTEQ